ncbi:sensor histidine kinase [Sporofaciens musculi]|uniref:sensor histidine kinase n=1 Tax=Sporofaciens musculi TaxID=2681861 RepID=UPI001FCA5114|nr:ATP-binding protein [Sporofaciens musculi]
MSEGLEKYFLLIEILLFLAQGHCLQYFWGSFLEYRMKNRYGGVWVMVLYAISRMCMSYLWSVQFGGLAAMGKQIVALCILAVLAFCFYRGSHALTLFLVTSFQAVIEISVYVVVVLMDYPMDGVMSLWSWCVREGLITSVKALQLTSEICTAGMHFLQVTAIVLLLRVSLGRIVKDYREKDYAIRRTELMFILTPALAGLLLCTLLRIIIISVEDDRQEFLYHRYPMLIVVLPAILLVSLLSLLYGVKAFQDIIRLNREKNSRSILQRQVISMQENMGEMERIYSGIRSMRHDMKNTLGIVMSLAAKNGRQEELQGYLWEIQKRLDDLEVRFRTGNAVVDALLTMKYHEIMGAVPELSFHTEQLLFPDRMEVKGYDMGIILGNALDNALEACVKLKKKEKGAETFIRIASFQRGKLLFLRMENSFDGNIIRKPQADFPATEKADRELHGIGLVNIRNAAKKYQGTVDWKVEGRTFILAVMLKDERRDGGCEEDM